MTISDRRDQAMVLDELGARLNSPVGAWSDLIDEPHADLRELLAAHQACAVLREYAIASLASANVLRYALEQPEQED